MELLDHYLKDVAQWLPRRQAADIVAEVSGDIHAEIEEQERELRRPLSVAEQEAIITRWGHPMLVASRYQPQEPFIGPALLPTYYFVLKVVSLVYLLPWALALVVFAFVPGWMEAKGGVLGSLKPLAIQALVLFALVTVVFAAIDRRQRRERTLEDWTARELTEPRAKRDWREKSRFSALFDLVVDVAVLSWWIGLAAAPASFVLDSAVRVSIPSAHMLVYWPVLALLAGGIAMAIADLVHPRWTIRRLGLQIAMDVTAVLVGAVLISFSILQAVPGADTDLAKSATLLQWVNLSWKITIGIVAVVLVGRIVVNVRRLGRVNSSVPTAAVMLGALLAAAFAG